MANRKASLIAAALVISVSGTLLPSSRAEAAVFNIPRFVMPQSWALGLEPELTLTDGSGVGINLKGTYGLNDLLNIQGTIGTGGGPRRFRVGGALVADIFPDLESQPGIGIAGQTMFYRLDDTHSLFEVRFIPYIHKSFKTGEGKVFEPFIAVPFGFGVTNGDSFGLSQLSLGSMFQATEQMFYVVELGISINRATTTVSGGMAFYF